MKIRPGIELSNLTDIGCERTENEDNYCYAEPEDDSELRLRGRCVVVADGMGGYEGGQVASCLAVDAVRSTFLNGPALEPVDLLAAAYEAAHAAIQEFAQDHPELIGMGTTCTTAVLRDGGLTYGHVGDSRLYLIREGAISRVTHDQSYVQRMIDDGTISAEDARTHPSRNVLTSALGSNSPVNADFGEPPLPLQKGDILLLCTDGLHGLVNDEEILDMASQNPPREACYKLVDMAKVRGGFDNITVQIVRIDEPSALSQADAAEPADRKAS
ncbi:MAG: Stp1/IreP family PP2C-type Ser/Thr phosphatase [Candidatus Acidiferrales bacterium]